MHFYELTVSFFIADICYNLKFQLHLHLSLFFLYCIAGKHFAIIPVVHYEPETSSEPPDDLTKLPLNTSNDAENYPICERHEHAIVMPERPHLEPFEII